MTLSIQNIESELSYAYIHAIAGKAGMSCKPGDRHDDGHGVDAEISFRGCTTHPYLTHVQLNVQLKATVADPGNHNDYVSYYFQGINRYNKLRKQDSEIYKILAVLFLPADPLVWLSCSADELIMKKGVYWTCLYGAEDSANDTGQTVYLPKKQLLTPDEMVRLANLAVIKKVPNYQRP